MIQDQNRRGGHRGWTRRDFLRAATGLTIAALLPGCRRGTSPILSVPTAVHWVETQRYRKDPPWRVGRAGRGDLSSWQVMLSAHIEYAITEKYRQYFADYRFTAANWDPDKQMLDIQKLLSGGIDLLLIDPLDEAAVAAGVKEATEAGVPVLCVSSGVQNAPYTSWLTTDEEERGALSADWLCQRVTRGRVVVLQSEPAPGEGRIWLDGVSRRLDGCPDLDVQVLACFWRPSDAQRVMSDALESAPIEGLIVNSGTAAQGAVQALSERGLAIPPIAGGDDCNGWLRTAKEHNAHFLGFGGSAKLGLRCVELAMDVLSGRPVRTYEEFPYQVFDEATMDRYYRPELSDHFWAMHDLPEAWIQRMFNP